MLVYEHVAKAAFLRGTGRVRAVLRFVALVAPLLLALPACAGKHKKAPPPSEPEPVDLARKTLPAGARNPAMRLLSVDATRCDPSGKRTEQQDLNRDGRADMITLTIQGSGPDSGKISCKQGDFNHDGLLDAYIHYSTQGDVVREQFDLDHDGRLDLGRYYEEGSLVLDEQDLNHDGYVDAWRRYDKGRLIRIDVDRDHDGRPDQFSFFVAGSIDRVGYDTTGDGKVDRWDQDIARRTRAALEARRRSPDKDEVEYVDEAKPETAEDSDESGESAGKSGKGKGKSGKGKSDKGKSGKGKSGKGKSDKGKSGKPAVSKKKPANPVTASEDDSGSKAPPVAKPKG